MTWESETPPGTIAKMFDQKNLKALVYWIGGCEKNLNMNDRHF